MGLYKKPVSWMDSVVAEDQKKFSKLDKDLVLRGEEKVSFPEFQTT